MSKDTPPENPAPEELDFHRAPAGYKGPPPSLFDRGAAGWADSKGFWHPKGETLVPLRPERRREGWNPHATAEGLKWSPFGKP